VGLCVALIVFHSVGDRSEAQGTQCYLPIVAKPGSCFRPGGKSLRLTAYPKRHQAQEQRRK